MLKTQVRDRTERTVETREAREAAAAKFTRGDRDRHQLPQPLGWFRSTHHVVRRENR
jgi:hypothetical protein